MDNLKQVETVKKVLDNEILLANTQNKLSNLLAENYPPAPNPPTLDTFTKTYPEIKSEVKFNWALALVPCIIFLPWIIIYYFAIYKMKRDEDIERIRNSEEYKAQCAQIDLEYEKQLESANQKYETEKQIYETETLPEYQKAYEEWTTKHNEAVDQTQKELNTVQENLNKIYEETKIVPMQYRKIEILQYIYDMISTSDYDVKQAIDIYDRNEQRKLDEAKLYEQQQANWLADEQNELLYKQNEIATKARRDANIAAAVSTVQRHNTNKTLNSFKKK